MKDYLGFENARNKQHAALYERLMKQAIGGTAPVSVLIGHHLTFEIGGELQTENEIPSADCLIFDHDFMGKVFGSNAIAVMRDLASVDVDHRDDLLVYYLDRADADLKFAA